MKGLIKDTDAKSGIVEKIAKSEKTVKEKIKLFTVKVKICISFSLFVYSTHVI